MPKIKTLQKDMAILIKDKQKEIKKYTISKIAKEDDSEIFKNIKNEELLKFLIKDGYIYAGVPPLYKVTIGKEYRYIKNDEELEKFKKANEGKKYQINRMKG